MAFGLEGHLHSQPKHVFKIPLIVGWQAFETPFHIDHNAAKQNCWDLGMFLSKIISFQIFTCTTRTSELLLLSTA
jgi:hypothetical protein